MQTCSHTQTQPAHKCVYTIPAALPQNCTLNMCGAYSYTCTAYIFLGTWVCIYTCTAYIFLGTWVCMVNTHRVYTFTPVHA